MRPTVEAPITGTVILPIVSFHLKIDTLRPYLTETDLFSIFIVRYQLAKYSPPTPKAVRFPTNQHRMKAIHYTEAPCYDPVQRAGNRICGMLFQHRPSHIFKPASPLNPLGNIREK